MTYLLNHVYKFSEIKNDVQVYYFAICIDEKKESFNDLYVSVGGAEKLDDWCASTFFGNSPSAVVKHVGTLEQYKYQYPEFAL